MSTAAGAGDLVLPAASLSPTAVADPPRPICRK